MIITNKQWTIVGAFSVLEFYVPLISVEKDTFRPDFELVSRFQSLLQCPGWDISNDLLKYTC
jgi:hypothetical protein